MYPGWRLTGSASLQENFLRLTNDRASKRASVWSTTRVQLDEWSTTIRFRVSGQGKRLFGDGLAFWFTANEAHRDGTLHGFVDTFKGFGVIFDTCVSGRANREKCSPPVPSPLPRPNPTHPLHAFRFLPLTTAGSTSSWRASLLAASLFFLVLPTGRFVNSDPGHIHKDIKFVTSDGTTAVKDEGTPIGCDADFRYWEGRDDVSVYNHSAVRIRFSGGRVSLWVDSKANGNWVSCFESALPAPPEGWWRDGGWIGLTATTGELADNHDLLSVLTGPEDEVAPKSWLDPRPELVASGNEDVDRAIRSAIAYENWEVKDRLSFLEHKIEHECVGKSLASTGRARPCATCIRARARAHSRTLTPPTHPPPPLPFFPPPGWPHWRTL